MSKLFLNFTGPARCFQVLHPKLYLTSSDLCSGFQSSLQWDQRYKCLGAGTGRWVSAELQPTWLACCQICAVFGGHGKCYFLHVQDWAKCHKSRAWQIGLIFNTRIAQKYKMQYGGIYKAIMSQLMTLKKYLKRKYSNSYPNFSEVCVIEGLFINDYQFRWWLGTPCLALMSFKTSGFQRPIKVRLIKTQWSSIGFRK